MKVFAVFLLVLLLVESRKTRNRSKLGRTLPNYKKFNHDVELLQGDRQNIPGQSINPVKSWETFVSQNEDSDGGSSFQQDHNNGGMSTKSTGSERFNTVEVIPGPRGPQGPPGMLLLEEFAETLELIKEVDGDIKRSRKGRYKAGGPVLNIVFSNGIRAGDLDGTLNNSDESDKGGFFGSLKTDIYLQRLSRLQISNFVRPRASSTSFNFNSRVDFDHRSGTLNARHTSIYIISATINLHRMPDDVTEMPDFEDNITGRICMDDNCLIWALETRTPVLHTKYSTLKLDGIVRVEAGNKVFLFVENNSGLNFKVLRSSTFSAYAVGSGG
ncbi:erythroferrone-like isoform X2 [Bolinopsis microptera]|uniref:erythroferrone-like isoform X2 n=1 Tax=Bolinopsis microptera TaxID=2820187 RepID=UPI00307A16A4